MMADSFPHTDSRSSRGTVVIMAGGTGGHVFPALAVAKELFQRGYHIEWLGTRRGIESRLVPEAGFAINYLPVAGMRGKQFMQLMKAPFQLAYSILLACQVMLRLRPFCVVGMGGFAAGPGGIAAWLFRRPLLIHEQNAVAGTTNRILARFARRVFQGYPDAFAGAKAQFIGNPVRKEIAAIPAPQSRLADREGPLRLLVLGGSLGARPINQVLPAALKTLAENQRPQVWHQCGRDHVDAVQADYKTQQVEAKVEPFIANMAEAYAWSDLVICRAGALTIAEVMAAGVAAILVPLPHAIDDHQTKNAEWLSLQQAGRLLPQQQMAPKAIASLLIHYQLERSELIDMASAARELAAVNVAEKMADCCEEYVHD